MKLKIWSRVNKVKARRLIGRNSVACFALFSLLLVFPYASVRAQGDKTENIAPVTYAPDYCQFMAIFPEEPYRSRQCEEPGKEESCYELVSYTKVIDMSSTVRVEIICNPSTPAMYDEFTADVMTTTVKAMTRGTVIEAYETLRHETEEYRQVGLLGKGRKGLDETIYISQLWIADQSIMSVEAELSGDQTAEADTLFADILRSIGYQREIKGEITLEKLGSQGNKSDEATMQGHEQTAESP